MAHDHGSHEWDIFIEGPAGDTGVQVALGEVSTGYFFYFVADGVVGKFIVVISRKPI